MARKWKQMSPATFDKAWRGLTEGETVSVDEAFRRALPGGGVKSGFMEGRRERDESGRFLPKERK